jgi:hypothetical protein
MAVDLYPYAMGQGQGAAQVFDFQSPVLRAKLGYKQAGEAEEAARERAASAREAAAETTDMLPEFDAPEDVPGQYAATTQALRQEFKKMRSLATTPQGRQAMLRYQQGMPLTEKQREVLGEIQNSVERIRSWQGAARLRDEYGFETYKGEIEGDVMPGTTEEQFGGTGGTIRARNQDAGTMTPYFAPDEVRLQAQNIVKSMTPENAWSTLQPFGGYEGVLISEGLSRTSKPKQKLAAAMNTLENRDIYRNFLQQNPDLRQYEGDERFKRAANRLAEQIGISEEQRTTKQGPYHDAFGAYSSGIAEDQANLRTLGPSLFGTNTGDDMFFNEGAGQTPSPGFLALGGLMDTELQGQAIPVPDRVNVFDQATGERMAGIPGNAAGVYAGTQVVPVIRKPDGSYRIARTDEFSQADDVRVMDMFNIPEPGTVVYEKILSDLQETANLTPTEAKKLYKNIEADQVMVESKGSTVPWSQVQRLRQQGLQQLRQRKGAQQGGQPRQQTQQQGGGGGGSWQGL